ncbi:MAG TPA: ATP-NAD kinase family protein [Gaiellaceae bacterium]|nr:ATP-NAD kinase family protein [Gaiellaceae bacterium]
MREELGLIVNPIAGLGGRVGLKGTDGPELVREALARGAVPVAPERTRRALARLVQERKETAVAAAPGVLGADLARAAGLRTSVLAGSGGPETTAQDTRQAAAAMAERGVRLLLFAGGDGTARDIVSVVGDRLPVLGIPTGVKMHSGVFATSPEAAGELAARFLRSPGSRLRLAEVVDVDEEELRRDRVSTRLYGVAKVPEDRNRVQHPKLSSHPGDAALDALAHELAGELRGLVVFGPGTTTQKILAALGVEGSLLGVDVVENGRLIGRDVDERQLLVLLDDKDARAILGVVGGQGFLLGRGNQQLSPAVLRRIGLDNIEIVAAQDKLVSLDPPRLRVDTGDPALDRDLCGYRRVRVAPGRSMVIEVST